MAGLIIAGRQAGPFCPAGYRCWWSGLACTACLRISGRCWLRPSRRISLWAAQRLGSYCCIGTFGLNFTIFILVLQFAFSVWVVTACWSGVGVERYQCLIDASRIHPIRNSGRFVRWCLAPAPLTEFCATSSPRFHRPAPLPAIRWSVARPVMALRVIALGEPWHRSRRRSWGRWAGQGSRASAWLSWAFCVAMSNRPNR